MKNSAIAFAILCSLFLKGQSLNVMTFNIRLSLESDKENSWENRKTDVLKLMNYYEPDLFGVQEAVPQQMADLKSGMKNYDFVGVGRDDGANKGEYSAIFYDTEELKVLQSGTFWLSETPEKPSKGWDAAYNRVCTYALFKMKKGGKKFWAFNVHFDHVGNLARENSGQLIMGKIKNLNSRNLPVVLTGDFNLTDKTAPIKIISKAMSDSFYNCIKPHYGPTGTFTGFNTSKAAKERIDYIFTKDFKCESIRTINDTRENLLYPSDHFPILAELKIR